MNIAIIGFGKMGRTIKSIAPKFNHNVVATIDPISNEADFNEINEKTVSNADICIEFTTPSVVLDNIQKLTKLKKNIIVGTTGWYDKIDEVKKMVEESGIKMIYAPNFAIGVNIFFFVTRYLARIMNNFPSYDASIVEFHHNQKKDIPSGTAIKMGEIIINELDRKKAINSNLTSKISENGLHIAGVRCGHIFGEHSVIFDSPYDTIILNHRAKSREIFAGGVFFAIEKMDKIEGMVSFYDLIKKEIIKE